MRFSLQMFMAAIALAGVPAVLAQESSDYDPSPFLSSMVALRAVAVTCDPFVANDPAVRTEAVVKFFVDLNQTLPDLVDTKTQASLNRFVASQAAVLCRDKLDASFLEYSVELERYSNKKPSDWPDPPNIVKMPWCSSENCLEF